MSRFVLTLAALLFCGVLSAGQYFNGFVNSDGYVWNADPATGIGYWYLGSQAYTRVRYETAGFWRCNYYYPGSVYWQYTAYYPPAAPAVTYKDVGWRAKLLDLAAQRDKFEGEIRKNAFEQASFMEAIKGLGLSGNFRWESYGVAPPYGPHPLTPYSAEVTNYGANATTQYGYAYSTLAQLYGTTDINLLYQQAQQLTSEAQKLGGEANAQFQGLVGAEAGYHAKALELIAKRDLAVAVLHALQGPNTVETKGFSFQIGPSGTISRQDTNVDPAVKEGLRKQWVALATNRCVACHGATSPKGGFNILRDYPTLTADKKQAVWARLTPEADEKIAMPRQPDGKVGIRLTQEEFRLFVLN